MKVNVASMVTYLFIVFFKTVLGWKHSGKVWKNMFGNFYFWGITLYLQLSALQLAQVKVKDKAWKEKVKKK